MGLDLGTSSAPTTQLGGGTPTPAPVGGLLNLTKGAKVELTKSNPGLDKITVGLGWDVSANTGATYDLDVEVFLTDANEKTLSVPHFIFYNNKISPDGAVKHNGDNRTGAGDGDDETVSIALSQVASDVQKAIFTVTIDQAVLKRQNFGQVNNAYIRIVNDATGTEICRYDLSEDYSTSISLVVGKVYRHNGEWKFEATGNGSTADLAGLCSQFGLS